MDTTHKKNIKLWVKEINVLEYIVVPHKCFLLLDDVMILRNFMTFLAVSYADKKAKLESSIIVSTYTHNKYSKFFNTNAKKNL